MIVSKSDDKLTGYMKLSWTFWRHSKNPKSYNFLQLLGSVRFWKLELKVRSSKLFKPKWKNYPQ